MAPRRHGKLQTVITLLDLFLRSTGIAFGLVLMLVVGVLVLLVLRRFDLDDILGKR